MNHRTEDLPLCLSSLYIRLSNEKIIKNKSLKKKRKKDLFIFIGKQIYREKERQKERSSVCWFTLQVVTTAGTELTRSQELLPGLPRGRKVPKLWAVLDCFPRPQAGSWKGSGAAGIRTCVPMGSRACKARTFNHLRHRAGPSFFS